MYKNRLTNRIRWEVDFSFHRNALLDIDWHYEWGCLWSIDIHLLKGKIGIWFQGDSLPF